MPSSRTTPRVASPLFLAVLVSRVSFSMALLVERMAAVTTPVQRDPPLPAITSMPAYGGVMAPIGKRQLLQSCSDGQSLCGLRCAYDCCDALAGWSCGRSGENCYTSDGYIGCCVDGHDCQAKTTCYDHPATRSCDPDSGDCVACDATNKYCVTELNVLASLSVMYCLPTKPLVAPSYVYGTATRGPTATTARTRTRSSVTSIYSPRPRTSSLASGGSRSRSTSLTRAAMTGIIIGVIAVVAIILQLIVLFFIRRRRRQRAAADANAGVGRQPSEYTPVSKVADAHPVMDVQPLTNAQVGSAIQQPHYQPVPTSQVPEMDNTEVPSRWSHRKPVANVVELPVSQAEAGQR